MAPSTHDSSTLVARLDAQVASVLLTVVTALRHKSVPACDTIFHTHFAAVHPDALGFQLPIAEGANGLFHCFGSFKISTPPFHHEQII